MAGLEFEPTPQYLSSFHWFFSLYVIFPKEKILLIIDKLLGNFYTVQPLDVMWVKVTQLCPTLCNPTDYTIHGILQAGILEWVAFPFSRGSSKPTDWTQVSHSAGGFFTSWVTRKAHDAMYSGTTKKFFFLPDCCSLQVVYQAMLFLSTPEMKRRGWVWKGSSPQEWWAR